MILDQIESAIALGSGVSLVSDFFRALFFIFDSVIYAFIPTVYKLIYSLYDFRTIFSDGILNNVIENMSSTIYSFLAIFMFFRTAFSLITMLVDPNVIDDKERGAKKIVSNIMICLLLIVAVPYGFRYARLIQSRIIDNHLIEQVVTGNTFNDSDYDLGNELALSVWSVFLKPAVDGNDDAINAYNNVFKNRTTDWNLDAIYDNINIRANGGFITRVDGAQYSLSYVFVFSTIAGVYVLWIFIKIMVDVAYRSIKFFALEVISPIAIVSYIDPSSSKKGIFSKWLSETVKTYISLFVRLFVFAFATVLLRSFSMSDLTRGQGLWVNLFYIIAIIAFITNGPSFIDNLFGTTMSKEGTSNLAKGMSKVLGFAGAATGAAVGGIANAVVARRVGKNAFTGFMSGAWNSGKKGWETGNKANFKNPLSAAAGIGSTASSVYGSYGDAKKKYGYEVDKDREKLINVLRGRVDDVNEAKSNAVSELGKDGQKYNEKLSQGAKVNGRKYGKGLEGDDGLENLFKKNAGGLAQDELLHQGDETYLELRRAVAKAKDDEAILSRVSAKANSQYSAAKDAYNSSDNKKAYVISFETNTARMQYGEMDDATLENSFNTELSTFFDSSFQNVVRSFEGASKEQKFQMFANISEKSQEELNGMSDAELSSEYQRALTEHLNQYVQTMKANYSNAATIDEKIDIVAKAKCDSLASQFTEFDEYALNERFNKANDERIVATFGQTIDNIESDSGKASGDAKKAQGALDEYLKSGKGKRAKDIDSAYSTADSIEKARKLEEKRRQQNNNK